MASDVFEKFIKKASPDLRGEILKAGQELDAKGSREKPINYDPRPLDRKAELSRPHAAEPKQTGVSENQPQRQPNAMDRALASSSIKSQAAEQIQTLQNQNVKANKEPER
ncbi:hypothetical protein GCM10028808_62500 [Spirosoma migulaei]